MKVNVLKRCYRSECENLKQVPPQNLDTLLSNNVGSSCKTVTEGGIFIDLVFMFIKFSVYEDTT